VAKRKGRFRFSTGCAWKIKLRNSDEFVSFTEAVGVDGDRGNAHAGAVWELNKNHHFGAVVDGDSDGVRGDAQEIDATIDYRVKKGFLNSFWLRVRGSWLNEESADRNGTEIRVILRHDFPVT